MINIKDINLDNTCLLMIDMQDRLLKVMANSPECVEKNEMLLKSAAILDLDTIVTEQYPKGLGHTADELKCLLADDAEIIEKTSFSCYGEKNFRIALKSKKRKNVIVCGIEAHVCVQQTVLELLTDGYNVIVAADALSSRDLRNYDLALETMRDAGAFITSSESVVFMLLRDAGHPKFREISKLVK
jgi:isochorismate hydrolase